MARKGKVFFKGMFAGIIAESEAGGYIFTYDTDYLARTDAKPVSLTLPLQPKPYEDKVLFSFFDGLIPEGWLLQLTTSHWKLKANDRMGLLLAACGDCIGAVHIEALPDAER